MSTLREMIESILPSDATAHDDGNWVRVYRNPRRSEFENVLFDDEKEARHFVNAMTKMRHYYKRWNYDTISESKSLWDMGVSLYTYHYTLEASGESVLQKENDHYLKNHKLPKRLTIALLDAVRESIANIACGTFTDSESCSYNSVTFK